MIVSELDERREAQQATDAWVVAIRAEQSRLLDCTQPTSGPAGGDEVALIFFFTEGNCGGVWARFVQEPSR